MVDQLELKAFAPCSALLGRVDSEYLDCVSDDLALLLAHAGVPDVREPFAMDWRFRLTTEVGQLPKVDLPPAGQAESLARRTGFAPVWQDIDDVPETVPRWREALEAGRPIVLVGDAYHLPWLPYHGNEHMWHGFVVEGMEGGREPLLHVVDPYDNATQWGHAKPMTTKISLGDIGPALAGGTWATVAEVIDARPVDLRRQLHDNAQAITSATAEGTPAQFLERHSQLDSAAVENLALQAWLLARDRGLHHLWLTDKTAELDEIGLREFTGRFESEVLQAWRRVTEMSYIALRRVHAGRAAPDGVLGAAEKALANEAELAGWLLARTETETTKTTEEQTTGRC
ncbi:MAG: BtrH N-terminal domain-containing protein [Kibdelosporangium sp.]